MNTITFNTPARSLRLPPAVETPLFGALEKNVRYTFAGKSALALLLRWYRTTGALRNRSDELLVPQWLGAPVYAAMHPYCFPTTTMNERVRGVLAYHQWGFPQRMDALGEFCRTKKLFLIEDCAHAFDSYYEGARVGTLGEASLFSLAKFFPSVVGGVLHTTNASLLRFVDAAYAADDGAFGKEVFANYFSFDRRPTIRNNRDVLRNYAVYDQLVRCPAYALAVARFEFSQGALLKRRDHYAQYQQAFKGLVPDVPPDEVAPWVVPLFAEEAECERVVAALRDAGVHSGVYHFDVQRNMLAPRFVPCVPLPCHQGITEKERERIIVSARRAMR